MAFSGGGLLLLLLVSEFSSSVDVDDDANADNGVQALEDPRRRHSILGLLSSGAVSLSAVVVDMLSLSLLELLADIAAVDTSSNMCSLDPVEPTSITCNIL